MATRIDKLEMQGFKSFAKKTVLLFPSNFSIVCGPNGSGKSNILDSVCFVLGRKSAKSLRADQMKEIVFKGTQKLAPAEFAKVSIYFDNRDKTFPYEDPQICVSRKVNAKGVSIYKINNESVTRETVLEVLRRANVHPDGHNIIQQGNITDIINMTPSERREIIDEISGISEFEEKREKANKELTTVEGRLNNSAIVLNERSGILKRLEAEKDAAEQYEHLTAELDKLRASKAKKDLANAEEAMSTLQKKIDERETEVALSDAEVAKIDSELGGIEKRTGRVQARLMDRGKDIALIKDVEAIRSEIFQKKAKAESDEYDIARINDVIKKLQALRDQQMEGNRAVQSIIRLGRTGVYGTVASLSQVPSAYQSAIEVCAGQHLFDIVTDSADTASECVRYLKENRIGRTTFLPLDKIKEREGTHLKKFLGKPGVVDIAINLIKFNQKYWHAFSHLFGDTLVVENLDIARRLGVGEARYVTLDGDLVERSGAITGGHYRPEKRAFTESDETEKYEADKKRLTAEIERLHAEIRELTAKQHSLSGEEQKGLKELMDLQRERDELEAALDATRQKRIQFYEHKVNAADEIQRLKIDRARLEAALENIQIEFQNSKKDVETYDLAPSTLQGKIRDVINRISELGAVNQKAVEEYKALKAEYDELKGRVDVLTAERNRVLEIIAGIEGRRRETFMKTLDAVTKQFTVIFKELMRGEGTLRLEGESLEDAGLIIEASPPGGKVLNIDAMSGGEKTMTALAFLFAVQEIKPAPFYILDEIDAALDKPNTKKMTQFIVENSKRAQFVVISHNDTTIQAADCIYGVSKEDGESRLVGIKMPE